MLGAIEHRTFKASKGSSTPPVGYAALTGAVSLTSLPLVGWTYAVVALFCPATAFTGGDAFLVYDEACTMGVGYSPSGGADAVLSGGM